MSAIIYDLRIERVRRELAKIYNVPVRKVQQVEKGLDSFYIYFDKASGFDTPFVLTVVSDGEVMFEADGKLTPEEIKEELDLFKETLDNNYIPPYHGANSAPNYSEEDYELLKAQMMRNQLGMIDNLPSTVAEKILEDLFKPKPE